MKKPKTAKSTEVPVTQKMLYLVRDELKNDIKSFEHKMDARFLKQDLKFAGLDAKFIGIDARLADHDSKFEKISSQIHELKILIEEQNARNIFVLDGLTSLFHRQDRVEQRLNEKS